MSCIFVSYSRHDLDYVSGLVQALESYGLSAWTDKRMEGGERWLTEIRKQLQECQAFLVVVSPRSEASNWVQIEIATAMELNKELIYPVLLEGKLWFPLTGYQGVDVRDGSLPSDKFFEKVRKELAIVTAKSPKKNRLWPLPSQRNHLYRIPNYPSIPCGHFGCYAFFCSTFFRDFLLLNSAF
jgi:hypothetical protein